METVDRYKPSVELVELSMRLSKRETRVFFKWLPKEVKLFIRESESREIYSRVLVNTVEGAVSDFFYRRSHTPPNVPRVVTVQLSSSPRKLDDELCSILLSRLPIRGSKADKDRFLSLLDEDLRAYRALNRPEGHMAKFVYGALVFDADRSDLLFFQSLQD